MSAGLIAKLFNQGMHAHVHSCLEQHNLAIVTARYSQMIRNTRLRSVIACVGLASRRQVLPSVVILVATAISEAQVPSRKLDRFDLPAVARRWEEWHKHCNWRDMLQISHGGAKKNGSGRTESHFRADKYQLRHNQQCLGGKLGTYIQLVNPKYAARIQKLHDADAFSLEEVVLRRSPMFRRFFVRPESELIATQLEAPVLINERTLWELCSDPELHELVSHRITRVDDDVLHHIHLRLPKGPAKISEVKLVASEKVGMLPIMSDLTYVPAAGDMVARVRWTGWQKVQGQWVWSQQHTEVLGKEPPRLICELNWDPPIRHNKRECWLSYYGLPEPPETRMSFAWILGISGAILLVLALAWKARAAGVNTS